MSHKSTDGLEDLARWRVFLAVHATGSLSAAARTMGVTQPAVSAQLQALERSLGEQLFVRGARGVTPTLRADELASRLATPFAAVAGALASIDPDAPATQPPARIGGAAELLAEVVAPALAPLIAAGVRVQVQPGLSGALTDALRTGSLDLVLASERPRGRALVATPLVDETFVLVAGAAEASRLSPRLAVDGPAALDDTPLLAYAHDLPILRRYWRHAFGVRLERQPALTLPDLRALRDAAIAGAGATVLPSYLCRAALDAGRLVDLLPSEDPPINTLYLVSRAGDPARPHVERVRRTLAERVAAVVDDTARAA
jgi:DNA-binding transcriptional LysR family regulator